MRFPEVNSASVCIKKAKISWRKDFNKYFSKSFESSKVDFVLDSLFYF